MQQLVNGVQGIELKSEIYLASCLVIDVDHPAEQAHLDALARALDLPDELCRELQLQVQHASANTA